ncbi:hypothetical protein B0H11DRAFT_1908589 [Mycena galericulata]|nr:hypothetical protein B0H11DRAFT_1908589 [Mycena galericulata]
MEEIQDEDPLAVPLSPPHQSTPGRDQASNGTVPHVHASPFHMENVPIGHNRSSAKRATTYYRNDAGPSTSSAPSTYYRIPTANTAERPRHSRNPFTPDSPSPSAGSSTSSINPLNQSVDKDISLPSDMHRDTAATSLHVQSSIVQRSTFTPQVVVPRLVKIVDRDITDSTLTVEHLTRNYTFLKVIDPNATLLYEAGTIAVPYSDLARTPAIFSSLNTSQLYQLATPHGRQVGFSSTFTQLEVLRGHKCIQSCPGWNSTILFTRNTHAPTSQSRPPQVVDIEYRNEYAVSPECTAQLDQLASQHHLPPSVRKPNLVRALMKHTCNGECTANTLVFEQTPRPRKEPFLARTLPDEISETGGPLTLQTLDDLDVLPMTLSNEILVDVDDGVTFISTYKLNRSFDYEGIVTEESVKALFSADMDSVYVPAFSPDIATFVSLYAHLKSKDMQQLCDRHSLKAPKAKPLLIQALLRHKCRTSDNLVCAGSRRTT